MTEKGNKSIKPIQAQSEPLGSLRHSLTGFGILENAYRLNDAWRKDSLELILKRSAETVSSITAGLRNLGVDQERVFALLEKIRVSWNEPNEKQSLLTPDEIHRNGPAWSDASAVIFTPEDAPGMLEIIRREISQSKRVWVASAFYSPGVINLLLSGFIRFTQNGGDLRVLTSTMGNFNRPDYLVHLRDTVPSIKVKVYHPHDLPFDKTPPPFHPKAWLFQRRDGKGALLIGSSNFTEAGFLKNLEWNYFSAHEVNIPFGDTSPFETALSEFTRYWDRESVEISEEFLSAYRERWHEPDAGRADSFDPPGNWSKPSIAPRPIVQFPVSVRPEAVPNPAQKEALFNLSRMRGQGIRKAAVIAATGVGKTHLAAFDYKESGLENVLFIAHRENILLKGRETFRSVLNDDLFGEFLGAGQEVRNGSGAVFAMIQTLSRQENLDRFSPEHFDYLVVDEFHRGMAPTYLKAIAYFKPRFMLCLTATPERMDGRDVLRLCDYNVAYEVRLLDAVDKGWLCPFQYFAVYDETDYRQIAWRGTHYDDEQLTKALSNDTRTAIVAANLRKYLPSNGKTKALAFCSSVYHAHYTAERLTLDHGIDALALSGNNSGDERSAALDRLTDENDRLQVICTVNIFNEGVDIPNLSHVLLLRPTQSFTVFLQQLGRGLRNAPSKEYLVVIDFVGNFKKAHVAPLALSGYTSVQEFMTDGAVSFKTNGSFVTLPRGCYLDPDLEAKRIWDREIRTILT
ncbi:MAG: DEAD/DEAH box helicase family protein, partial [Deltaproteobacteria bacterium]|nr:DEAD/DEAH box helicase family protein [Deltaproteobacteria bacterium]